MTEETKPVEREARTLAKELVYSVRGWGQHSPQFMTAMVGRWEEKIAEYGQASADTALERAAAIAEDERLKAATWEEANDSNAAWYVKVTCERIGDAILALKGSR